MRSIKSVCFIVSSGKHYGYGHLMRCVALAQEFRRNNFKIFFLIKKKINFEGYSILKKYKFNIINFIDKYNKRYSEVDYLVEKKLLKFQFIVIDGYKYNIYWQKYFYKKIKKNNTLKLIKIDDFLKKNLCDYFIFFNSKVKITKRVKSLFSSNCKLFIGPEYALLRDEIISLKFYLQKKNFSKNIYVSAGGVNWHNFSSRIMNLINLLKIIKEFKIFIFSNNKNYKNNKKIYFFKKLSDQNNILKKKPLVIGYAGYSSIERAVLGLKSVCFRLNENQNRIYSFLRKKKLIYGVKNILDKSSFKSSLLSCILDNKEIKSPYNIYGKKIFLKKINI